MISTYDCGEEYCHYEEVIKKINRGSLEAFEVENLFNVSARDIRDDLTKVIADIVNGKADANKLRETFSHWLHDSGNGEEHRWALEELEEQTRPKSEVR